MEQFSMFASVTPANVHDSNEFLGLLDENDEVVYADSAYVGRKLPEHIENKVCEKGFRGKPLTSEQKESNRKQS